MSRTFLAHPIRFALPAVAGSLLCAGALVAQGNLSLPADLTERATEIAERNYPDGTPSGVWASGRNYKVSFHDGLVYYPHVGPDLPHQPVRWRTTSVRVGGHELLTGNAAPKPRWRDQRCEFDLGPVVERYDVLDEGVEQSFVFSSPPGDGDIVITGEVVTPLHLMEAAEGESALRLTLADGRPIVSYGSAVAIDAGDRRAPVLSSSNGETITLRLAGSFVADASYPLVIDPLLTNVQLESGAPITDADVLHETLSPSGSQARTWVVYSREVAAGDNDLWVKRFATNFGGSAIDTFDELSMWDAKHGRIALAPGSGDTVTVFAAGPFQGGGASSAIYMHRHAANDLARRTSLLGGITSAAFNDFQPDIGGRYDSGSEMLIVFRRDDNSGGLTNTANSAVYGAVIDPGIVGNNIITVAPFVLRNRPNRDQERPTVNQSAGGPEWLVAFQGHDGTIQNDDWEIGILGVDSLGNTGSSTLGVDQAGTVDHKMGPQVAGADGRYLLTYLVRRFELMNPKPQAARGQEVYAQRIDWDHGAAAGVRAHPPVLLDDDNNRVLRLGGVAFDHLSTSHWCATVDDNAADVYTVYKLGYRGRVVESGTFGPLAGVDPKAGGVTFNHSQRDFPLVVGANDGSANGNRLYGTDMAYDPVQPPTTYGFGCGTGVFGGLTAMESRQQIGAEDLRFELTSAPVNSFAILALSLNNTQQGLGAYGLIGCDLLVDLNAGAHLGAFFLPVSGGSAEFTVDFIESLAPATLYAQWFYEAPPNVNPANLLTTEGLGVQIGR